MKILIAEDDALSRQLLEDFLTEWGYEFVTANDGAEAWKQLQGDAAPRLAILDWMMPEKDGLEICREVRNRSPVPYTYILLVTAKGQREDILEGLEAGADDYVTKPFDPHELRARLRAGSRIIELQQQLLLAQEQLRVEATHDSLTGLWNRGAILEILQREIARSIRQKTPIAAMMADLDLFKTINENYGYLAGDVVLREAARRMLSSVRAYDAIGRYGGDEFLIVTDVRESAAHRQAERLRVCIGTELFDILDTAVSMTSSLGVAVSSEAKSADQLVKAADDALFRAKRAGRNRVELATSAEIAQPKTTKSAP
jgi:diguanylate cyclase (GGDEF)-like protein